MDIGLIFLDTFPSVNEIKGGENDEWTVRVGFKCNTHDNMITDRMDLEDGIKNKTMLYVKNALNPNNKEVLIEWLRNNQVIGRCNVGIKEESRWWRFNIGVNEGKQANWNLVKKDKRLLSSIKDIIKIYIKCVLWKQNVIESRNGVLENKENNNPGTVDIIAKSQNKMDKELQQENKGWMNSSHSYINKKNKLSMSTGSNKSVDNSNNNNNNQEINKVPWTNTINHTKNDSQSKHIVKTNNSIINNKIQSKLIPTKTRLTEYKSLVKTSPKKKPKKTLNKTHIKSKPVTPFNPTTKLRELKTKQCQNYNTNESFLINNLVNTSINLSQAKDNNKSFVHFTTDINTVTSPKEVKTVQSLNFPQTLDRIETDWEYLNNFDNIYNDFKIFYTSDYISSIQEEMLTLEAQLFIDKIFELQQGYHIELNNRKNIQNKYYLFYKHFYSLYQDLIKQKDKWNRHKDRFIKWQNSNESQILSVKKELCIMKNRLLYTNDMIKKKKLIQVFSLVYLRNKKKEIPHFESYRKVCEKLTGNNIEDPGENTQFDRIEKVFYKSRIRNNKY